ncbi:MAG: LD-carboxypeptidase [Burkholderiales bacterium]|jgi:muramoyltetrapeptide carboxypeptidase
MNRRTLLESAIALSATAVWPILSEGALPKTAGVRTGDPHRRRALINPRQLRRGDLIGLVAPSGSTNATYVDARVKQLEAKGFRVKLSRNLFQVRGNTAGTAKQRADDLHTMFTDDEVQAIWAIRGGSGASQILPLLDYPLIRRHAKIFIGFSDITALHLAMLKHSGLVTFHGPTAPAATISDYSWTQLEAVLMHPREQTTLYMAEANRLEAARSSAGASEFAMRVLSPGVAEGQLIGGNLAVLSALMGTPYAPDWRGALLFLEEIREAPYRIDRMLTQLKQVTPFEQAAGLMLGVFRRSVDSPESTDTEPRLTLEMAIDDHFRGLRVPAVYGMSFGHISHNLTLPLGVRARLDTTAQTLTLLEPAVLAR